MLARVAARLKQARHVDDDAVVHLRTREVTLEALPQQRVDVDGELEGHTPLSVSVIPQALKVFAPRQG